jgi:hypothetical protein
MSNADKVSTAESHVTVASTWRQRTFTAAFLGLSVVAMLGWLIGLGWVAITFANWVFF